jgi:hypothetical protein
VSGKNLALDWATRNLIAKTIEEIGTIQIRNALERERFTTQDQPAPQLHGPCSLRCESFVIGAVLSGAVPIDAVPLARSDFWGELTGRVWEAMTLVYDARLIPVVVETAIQRGTLAADAQYYETILGEWVHIADHQLALRDLSSAVLLLLEYSKARRLVRELARLADGICGGSECFDSAKNALRELFVSEAAAERARLA